MSHSPLSATSEPKKLNLTTKLAYGVGDFGTAISAGILSFYQLEFLVNVAGLNSGLAGSVRGIASIWDAVNDPIVGMLSDRTRTRWGRRYPWIIAGALPLGIFFFLHWIVPQFSTNPASQQTWLFWFYVLISIVFNTAFTAVNLPYTALTPELTRDYNERTSLTHFRFIFSIGGSILSLILAFGIFALVKDPAQQYVALGGVCALLCIFPSFLCVWGTQKRTTEMANYRTEDDPADALPYLQQLKIAFSNRPFLFVVGIYLCSWLAVQNTASVIPFFITNRMHLPDIHRALAPLALQGTAFAMLSVWSAVSHRVGKKAVYLMGMGCWVIAGIGIFLVEPNQVALMYFFSILAGCGVSTAFLVPWSMIPDVIELDELQTGQRREGVFYGFMVFVQKAMLLFAQLLTGFALSWAGFQGGRAEQSPTAEMVIRLLMGPVPVAFLLIGMVLAYFYPLTREIHAQILLQLKQRQEMKEQDSE